jgi:hypothetical protein
MGITDKMNQLVNSMQAGAKNASTSVFLWILKVVTAFLVSMTLAMVGQELFSYGFISFIFVLILSGAALIKIMSNWSVGAVLIFDLICILVALLLRMYILIAP